MLYQLPNGRVIEMSTEQFCDMTDDDFEYLIANNYGEEVEDPFFGSVLTGSKSKSILDTFPDIPAEVLKDLTQITDQEKLTNPDIDYTAQED